MTEWANRIIRHENVDPTALIASPFNFRRHPQNQKDAMVGVLNEIGWIDDVIVNVTTGRILDGHLRVEMALANKEPTVPVKYVELTEEQELLALSVFDYTTSLAELDGAALADLLGRVAMTPVEDEGVAALLAQLAGVAADGILAADAAGAGGVGQAQEQARATLAERFLVPPFSVLDARQGYWQERKRAWIALGIQSELGRGENALDMSATMAGITDEDERAACSTQRRESPKHSNSPGGSPRPAASLGKDGKTQRGDGKGKPIGGGVRMALHNDPMQRKDKYDAQE